MPASANPGSEGTARDPKLNKRLVIRPGAIGDCIVSLPAIETLKTGYTEVWVRSQNVPLIGFADRVRSIESAGLDLVGFEGLGNGALSELEGFDSIVSWYGTNRQDFRDAVAGLPFSFYGALPEGAAVHAVDFYMRQVGGPDGAMPRIDYPRCDGAFIAIHPFSGSAAKNWPLENFLSLAPRLPLPVEYCAGPEEPLERARRFKDLGAVASWLASARAYVGNDSGISHLAAAVGTPVVAIFRTTNPDVWAPRGENVVVLREPAIEQVRLAVLSLC